MLTVSRCQFDHVNAFFVLLLFNSLLYSCIYQSGSTQVHDISSCFCRCVAVFSSCDITVDRASLRCCRLFGRRVENVVDEVVVYVVVEVEEEEEVDRD